MSDPYTATPGQGRPGHMTPGRSGAPAATTPVSTSVLSEWNILQQVRAAQASSWNVAGSVSASVSSAWIVYGAAPVDSGTPIENYCTNPSFEAGLAGWSALTGTTLAQNATFVAYGQQAMMVATDGATPGEGFYGPSAGLFTSNLQCSGSIFLFGPGGGTVTVAAVSGTTGVVLASAIVTLTGAWQRAQVSGFTVTAGDTFYMVVQTTGAQALTFWADGAQMEFNVTTASQYIDGDQPGCQWLGTPELSASLLPYQHTATATGAMRMSGYANPEQYAEEFDTAASGSMTLSGDMVASVTDPVAAFDDFALFELTDPDPAMTYADQNNAGTHSGHTTWAQNYGLFYPPLDYPVSGGNFAWRRAQYMALGLKFGSVAAGQEQNISMAQVSLSPVTTFAPLTLPYTPPRQIQTIIKPTRLNYVTNPSFEVSSSGWSGTGTGTIARDTTTSAPDTYLTLAQPSIGPYTNSVAIARDASTGAGNFDGSGYSYSAEGLAAAGVAPGAEVTSGGITYAVLNTGPGDLDSVSAIGQTIPTPGPVGVSLIGFLGASAGGGMSGVSGTVTVTYTDTTTDTATLGFTDWTLDAGASAVLFSNQIAATVPYRHKNDGTTDTATATYLFTQTIPVNPAKAVATITFPNAAGLHVFAVSLGEAEEILTSTTSGKITVNATNDGAEISVPGLILGDTYVASVYLQAGAGLADIYAQCSGGEVILSSTTGGVPYGGEPGIGYGQGPYGGVPASSADIPTGIWQRVSFTFTAAASTETLTVFALPGSDVSYPANFWVGNVLVEGGTELQPYFDGSYGATDYLDYQWEGTAGLSRSYYYQQLAVKKYTIDQILAKHTPLGITYAAPLYLELPTQ